MIEWTDASPGMEVGQKLIHEKTRRLPNKTTFTLNNKHDKREQKSVDYEKTHKCPRAYLVVLVLMMCVAGLKGSSCGMRH